MIEGGLGRGVSYKELVAGDLFVFTGHKGSHKATYMALEAFDQEGCRLCECGGQPDIPVRGFYATATVRKVLNYD